MNDSIIKVDRHRFTPQISVCEKTDLATLLLAGFWPNVTGRPCSRRGLIYLLRQYEESMSKYVIQSKRGAPPRGAYAQGWRAGDFIFVTGTGPIDPLTGELMGESIEQQTEQTITNISTILEADGASLCDVVKVTVHLSDTSLFARYNTVYARRFSEPYPVRTTVGSDLGHAPGMLIEMDCIAYRPRKTSSRQPSSLKKKVVRRRR